MAMRILLYFHLHLLVLNVIGVRAGLHGHVPTIHAKVTIAAVQVRMGLVNATDT